MLFYPFVINYFKPLLDAPIQMQMQMPEKQTFVPLKVDDTTTVFLEGVVLDPEEDVSFEEGEFKKITDSIEAVAKKLSESIRKAKPQKASVEFSVEVGIESGVLTTLIAKGTGTSTFKVTLEWAENKDNDSEDNAG